MRQKQMLLLFLLFQVLGVFAQEQVKPPTGFINAHPADHLPPYIKLVCGFGQQPPFVGYCI
jgi:hypothetical protein